MKKIYLSVLAATMLFAACNNAPKGETAEVSEEVEVTSTVAGESYNIDPNTSTVSFEGATPSHSQTGSFRVGAGAINVDEGKVTGADITIKFEDVTITSKDMPDEEKEKLKGHLLNEDFFNTKVNKEVKFETTKVSSTETDGEAPKTEISGNLTMNGKTNNITFPAEITTADGKVNATASFVINRKDWGIVYGNDKSLGDKWIYDEVKMSFDITANK